MVNQPVVSNSCPNFLQFLNEFMCPSASFKNNDDVSSIGFNGFNKRYKVSIRQSTGSKGYWVGTKIIFSGKDALSF